jgi:hypothetical protein
MNFILENINSIGGAIIALILCGYAVYTRQWWLLKAAAYKFMADAERTMQTEEGKDRMEAVFSAIWKETPEWIKKVTTKEKLQNKLQEWYDLMKGSLKEN